MPSLFPLLDHPGPKPPGDPAAMKAAADRLRQQARQAGRLGATVRTPTWQGNTARLFGPRLKSHQDAADDAATDLDQAARLLDDAADDLRVAQRTWSDEMTAYRRRLRDIADGRP
ncbi:MAG TPA: hypothetical protein VF244_01410 [Acidimicrobiales bacterium]